MGRPPPHERDAGLTAHGTGYPVRMDKVDPGATTQPQAGFVVDPGVDIGHVHLKVADIDRALAFYCGVLGFEVMARMGAQAAFISAGGYHHHIGLNTWESRGRHAAPARSHRALSRGDPLSDSSLAWR